MKTPVLETDRLLLRPLCVADAETIFKNWTNNPNVTKFMRYSLHKTISDTREWLEIEEKNVLSDSVYNWGFVWKEKEMLIGSGGLVYQQEIESFELGYNIMEELWNQGLTTEAAQRIIKFAKEELKQSRLFACHAKENKASGRVMQKVGFRYSKDGHDRSFDKTREFETCEYILTLLDE